MSVWAGKHVVVIGASSGVGRSAATQLVQAGADVIFCARRAEVLDEAIAEAGGGRAVAYDVVGDPDVLVEAIDDRPVDLLLICAGIGVMAPLSTATVEQWTKVLGVNLIGVNRAIAAVTPALSDIGMVVVLSSESAGHPLWGLGVYSASKAALETSLKSWKQEYPGTRFSCLSIGATVPSDFPTYLDPALLGEAFGHWTRRGYAPMMMATPELADSMLGMLGAILPYPTVNIEYAMVRAPEGAVATDLHETAARQNNVTI